MWCSGRVAGAIMNYRPCGTCVVALRQGRMVVVTPGCSTDAAVWETQVGAGQRNVGRKIIASETGRSSAQCLCDVVDRAEGWPIEDPVRMLQSAYSRLLSRHVCAASRHSLELSRQCGSNGTRVSAVWVLRTRDVAGHVQRCCEAAQLARRSRPRRSDDEGSAGAAQLVAGGVVRLQRNRQTRPCLEKVK
jgi:hypothetical protein